MTQPIRPNSRLIQIDLPTFRNFYLQQQTEMLAARHNEAISDLNATRQDVDSLLPLQRLAQHFSGKLIWIFFIVNIATCCLISLDLFGVRWDHAIPMMFKTLKFSGLVNHPAPLLQVL